jgi:hypothetical protein
MTRHSAARWRRRADRWPTRAEVHEALRRATALLVLSRHEPHSLSDLLDNPPVVILKVRATVPGELAKVRMAELIELGATLVLAAQDLDAVGRLLEIAGHPVLGAWVRPLVQERA